jgi:molybdopterin converting factor subunit 1
MKVRLLFFAILRDIAGRDQAEVELTDGATARDVWQRLRGEHAALRDVADPPLAAINESYAEPDAPLHEGDELAFIPPVAGG